MGGVLCRGFLSIIRINIFSLFRCSGDGNCSHRCTFCFFEFATPIFLGQSVATTQHLNRTENSQITNQPVHIRTLAVSASSTATSAVNLFPKPLLSLYLCVWMCGCVF